jgi:hypothetical protein
MGDIGAWPRNGDGGLRPERDVSAFGRRFEFPCERDCTGDFLLSVILELLGMTLAHLNAAETRVELSPRVPLRMAIRGKLALALGEES